jgi:hypothetical protein
VDEYGAENSLTLEITKCIKDESVQCLEKNNVQFIINDKCAIFPDKYKWVSESGIKIVFSGNCLDIYETNPKEFNKPSVPLRFIIGVLISLMALCWIIKNIVIPKITSTRLMML